MKPRHELKHRINFSDMCILKTMLGAVAFRDEFSSSDGTYTVKSLYFDNYMDKALKEKVDGVDYREKFRLRYYGTDTSFINLEKKSKKGGLCYKEKVRITKEECQKIIEGDIGFMLKSDSNLLRELYAKMNYQLLRPKCIVTYVRESFVYPAGNVRVTIDSEISASNSVHEFLNPELKVLKVCNTPVLEVKWDEFLPQIIREAVGVKSRRASAFSKYAAARFI